MKNVLILCDVFPPAFSPRMGYLCKYLGEYGWKPVIITEYVPQNMYKNLADGQDVTYINYYWSKNKTVEKIKYLLVFLADFLFNYKDFIIKRKANRIMNKKKIDIILASSYRTFPAWAVCQLSQKYHIPLLVDLRDIFEQFPNNEHISKKTSFPTLNHFLSAIITKRLLRQRHNILKNADVVTTVSDWHVETLSKYNANVQLIYNGFDSDLFYPQIIENKKFIVTYTGRIESLNVKDPSLFFETVARLFAKKKIDIQNFQVQFYLPNEFSKEIIRSLAKKHEILDFIHIFDIVQNSEIPNILNNSSILLLLANKATGEKSPKGIMGTKLFEYLAVEKPILCVRNDEDCLERTIKSANAGLAASTVDETEEFILEKLAEWQQNGYTRQQVNREYIQPFARKHQAEQFAGLFDSLCNK